MKVFPITTPLPGEHLIATWPRMRPQTSGSLPESDPGWRLRLRYWEGRALTREALDLEQSHRAAHLAWRGRVVSPGVVRGLESGLEAPSTPPDTLTLEGHFLHLLPGYGITVFGEDVVNPRSLRVELADVPIEGVEEEVTPWASVIVIRPAEFNRFDNMDPDDPCELDPSRDAFADERRQDAAELRLIPLPDEWETHPEIGDPADPRRRNRLAHFLFSREAAGGRAQLLHHLSSRPAGHRWLTELQAPDPADLPWLRYGVPIGLLSSELDPISERQRWFLDRASVVRPGGKALPRSRSIVRLATEAAPDPPAPGSPDLWRARVDQFSEQMSSFDDGISIEDQSEHFRFLPPAGLLPRSALQLLTTSEAETVAAADRAAVSRFFPSRFSVEAVPIPTEDLDAALAASAPVAPFDLAAGEQEVVRLLVPLPQHVFDPELLVIEREDPVFAREVGRLVAERQDWRQRHDFIRGRRDALQDLATGPEERTAPARMPGQLEPEPVETLESLAFTEALLSPSTTQGPWEVQVSFATVHESPVDATLFVDVRTDAEAVPGPVEVSWHRPGANPVSYRWDAPPSYPLEQFNEDGQPAPTPLWRRFTVHADAVGLEGADINGFTLRFESGRLAISGAGQLLEGDDTEEDIWWRPAVEADGESADVEFVGGAWTQISGEALLAPFENPFEPEFRDGLTLDERLSELPTLPQSTVSPQDLPAGEAPVGRFRDEDITVQDVGLERYIEELLESIDRADDVVDIGFLKAQTNIHRIRQVLLGDEAANELLISPALSSVIKKKSALSTEEELVTAFKLAKRDEAAAQVSAATSGGGGEATVSSGSTSSGATGSTESAAFSSARFSSGGFSSGMLASGTSFGGSSSFARPIFEQPQIIQPGIIQPASGKLEAFQQTEFFGVAKGGVEFQKSPLRKDILGSEPLVGKAFDVRTLTIAKRFDSGPVRRAYDYADAGFREAIAQIIALDLDYDATERVPDVTVERDGEQQPVTFVDLASGDVDQGELQFAESVSSQLQTNEDTAAILSRGIRRADATVLIYRRFEFYIARRRELLNRAREVLAEILNRLSEARKRLVTVDGKLAEARHDVSVARALREEEQERIEALNERRDALIRNEVRFLAFVRPRTVDTSRRVLSGWKLEHAAAPAPIPACLQEHDEPPDPLRAYVQLFRHSPARWFAEVEPHLQELNTREKLHELLQSTRLSSARFVSQGTLPFVRRDLQPAPTFALQTGFSIVQAQRRLAANRVAAAESLGSWSEQLRRAREDASLGDLIDGRHGVTGLSRRAADELEQIEQVATCMHAEFASLPPAVRLQWIERYSQFDQPSPLNEMTALPGFGSLPRATRRRLQEFADWLFGRVVKGERDAFNLVNDLVRICLLLASHAPVKQIISGHVPRPVAVRPGIRIPLRPIDPGRVRVGMEFRVWRAGSVVARGRVEDLDGEEVSARVDHVGEAVSTIEPSMQVQFIAQAFAVSA